jgi:hypothetical protein
VTVEERNFAELAGEFACDNFWKRHEAGLRLGRHGEAALERSRAVSSADPGAEDEGVAAVEGDGWLWFSGNPIWPGSIPDGWELEWENDDEE